MLNENQYWLSQPPAVRALRDMPIGLNRGLLAASLAKQGFAIDVPIMVNGWGASIVMAVRQADGMTWVPRLGMPDISSTITGAAVPSPPYAPYDPDHPPAGAIKVSTDAADYPPFDPPVAVQPPDTHVVGAYLYTDGTGRRFYNGGPAALKDSRTPTVVDGQQVAQDGVTYTAHVNQQLMGVQVFFSR